jgi:hypothetical protein
MATRQGTVRVDAAAVQGEGAFVVVRKLGYAQRQKANQMLTAAFGGKLAQQADTKNLVLTSEFLAGNDAYTRELLTANVVAWNWVDDAGAALALPAADPNVIEGLTEDEVTFLTQAIQGSLPSQAADSKN